MINRSFDECNEKRMGIQDGAPVFRMELGPNEPGMIDLLHDLYQSAFGIDPGRHHSMLFKILQEVIIKFVTMPVPFAHHGCAISLLHLGSLFL